MPKQSFPVRGFQKGMYGNADRRDVPEGFAAYTENVEGSVPGRVRGIRQSSSVSPSFDPRIMIAKRFGTPEIIGQDSSKQIKVRTVNSGTETNIGSPTTNFVSSMVAQKKNVYCGTTTTFKGSTPGSQLWIGEVDNEQFNNGQASARTVSSAGLENYSDIQEAYGQYNSPKIAVRQSPLLKTSGIAPNNEDVGFVQTLNEELVSITTPAKHFFGISLVYDDSTESPLIRGWQHEDELFYFNTRRSLGFYDIKALFGSLTVFFDSWDLSRRVTGFVLYHAENPDESASEPSTQYRFIREFDINLSESDGFWSGDELYGSESEGLKLQGGINDTETTFTVDSFGTNFPPMFPCVGDKIRIDSEEMDVTAVSYTDLHEWEVTVDARSNGVSHDDDSHVDFLLNWWIETDNNNISGYTSGEFWAIRWVWQGSEGATYEERTGRPATLESTSVDYKISTDYNSQLFAGVCDTELFDDASQIIFRSAPNQYSSFNTAEHFVQLPEVPTALAGYGGRVYAFSETNMYRINPQGLYVEDTFHGTGSLNEDTVISTNYGMFHADENNIYINDGNQSTPIGDPILRVMAKSDKNYGWRSMAKTVSVSDIYARLEFDPENNRLLVFGATEADGSETVCWAYDVIRQRWDLYIDLEMPLAAANIPDGTLYITADDGSDGLDLVSLFTNSSRHNWSVISPSYALGAEGVEKYLYEIKGRGTGGFEFEYEVDTSGTFITPITGDDGIFRLCEIAEKRKGIHSVSVKVSSSSATDKLDSFQIIFRPKQLVS